MHELDVAAWDVFLDRYPDAHILQTAAWGELKAAFGWRVVRVATDDAGAQILFRKMPFGLSIAYIPKGPVGNAGAAFWREVDQVCHARRTIFLKVEPDAWMKDCENSAAPQGFNLSRHTIQPARTLVVDLSGDEANVLARMKQKTRYNVRLALKRGIVVRSSSDIETFYRMLIVTARRDHFDVHNLEYYQLTYDLFHPHGQCELLQAEYQGEPVAALMVFARGPRAWYFYGASLPNYRELMPTYLLQWEAMRWARSMGCREYDLWGVPDFEEAHLEALFPYRATGLWGVYRFKRGFGGELRRALGPWDRVYNRLWYALYLLWMRASARNGG